MSLCAKLLENTFTATLLSAKLGLCCDFSTIDSLLDMSWHMKPEKGFTRPLDLAFVALPQSPLSKQQQQPLHRNSTETKGLLVSSRLKTFQMKKNARRRAPGGSRNRWIYSTCGSPTISPVDATAANSASKLNKSKGTSGLVSYLPKSIA